MAKTKGETKTYKAKSPIQHDGEPYAVGEDIELTDKEAKALLEVGAIEPEPAVPAAPSTPSTPKGAGKGKGPSEKTEGEDGKKPEGEKPNPQTPPAA